MATMHEPNRHADSLERVDGQALNAAINRTVSASLWTSRASAAVLLAIGVAIWTGNADELIPVHIVAGVVLVLSLWTIATIAARSGVSGLIVSIAVVWSVAAAVLGLIQQDFVMGAWHWTVQVFHLLVAMAMVGWCQYLVIAMRRADAARGR